MSECVSPKGPFAEERLPRWHEGLGRGTPPPGTSAATTGTLEDGCLHLRWYRWRVGIRGRQLSSRCDVYAFDPTEGLAARHKMHASDPEQRGRVHFEAAGLGGEVARPTLGARHGSFDPNKTLTAAQCAHGAHQEHASKRATPIVDVLEIDCEGASGQRLRRSHAVRPTFFLACAPSSLRSMLSSDTASKSRGKHIGCWTSSLHSWLSSLPLQ